MPKNTTPKPLSTNYEQWKQVEQQIQLDVETICVRCGDPEQSEAFVRLLSLCTDDQYDRIDREVATFTAMRLAFSHTKAFERAMESALKRAA